MELSMAYKGASKVISDKGLMTLNFQPNLSREPVAFDAEIMKPLRFREAVSALHDVVTSDLRFKKRDKSAYEQWKKERVSKVNTLRQQSIRAQQKKLKLEESGLDSNIIREFKYYRKLYWDARRLHEQYVMENDPDLWRLIMPLDPVITVGEDVVFLEGFSADESSYGCLTINRDEGFSNPDSIQLGTTNVDYSWDLYHHFQRLRTYRQTMFRVDTHGFELQTQGSETYREEKIDLPKGWLRGFMQIQSAMGLPKRKVPLTRESVYSLLAWLKDHREKTGPRAIRFDLIPGKAPKMVLEPWEKPISSHGTIYDGPVGEPVRIWGRRRLLALSRLLPLADGVDVYLLGSGFPSFWLVKMGEMRFTLGLSGWTANDWTRGSAMDLLAPPTDPQDQWLAKAAHFIRTNRYAGFKEVESIVGYGAAATASTLNRLALTGQVIYDLGADVYRWRQILPMVLGEAEIGEPNPELAAAAILTDKSKVRIMSTEPILKGSKLIKAKADNSNVELIIDPDGIIKRGSCLCEHHRKFGLKNGPCRHLIAARSAALQLETNDKPDAQNWYDSLTKWSNN